MKKSGEKNFIKNNITLKLQDYSSSNMYPFHMPGHKRNPVFLNSKNPVEGAYSVDITEIDGFDNLHNANGIILDLMNNVSDLYGTLKSFILINGSSCGILSAVHSVVSEGETILIARNCHKSVYNACFLKNLRVEYLYPSLNERLKFYAGISPKEVEAEFKKNTLIKAVVITSPTYEGVVSDIEKISEITHSYGAILIVDEAHGAHFQYSNCFPESAVSLGADIVIQSIHKTLPALTQTALMHICSERVSAEKINKYLGIFQTSSPSYVLMSSVDSCISMMRSGEELMGAYIDRLRDFYRRTEIFNNIKILGNEYGKTNAIENVFDYDYGKIVIFDSTFSLSGVDLMNILREEFSLEMEMSSDFYVIGMTSVMDSDEGINRLAKALEDIDKRIEVSKMDGRQESCSENDDSSKNCEYRVLDFKQSESYLYGDYKKHWDGLERKLSIGEAEKSEKVWINIANAYEEAYEINKIVGKIAGEYIYIYPPGSPLIVPGEVYSEEIVARIKYYIERKLNIIGISDGCVSVLV